MIDKLLNYTINIYGACLIITSIILLLKSQSLIGGLLAIMGVINFIIAWLYDIEMRIKVK